MAKKINDVTGNTAEEILPAMEHLRDVFKKAIELPVPTPALALERNEILSKTVTALVSHTRVMLYPDVKGTDVIAAIYMLKECHRAASLSPAAGATGDTALPRKIKLLKIAADRIMMPRNRDYSR